MTSLFHDRLIVALLGLASLGLVSGLGLRLLGQPDLARIAWTAGVVPVLAAPVVEIVRGFGQGEVGLAIVAALSMSAALLFGETLAAAVVALSVLGGLGASVGGAGILKGAVRVTFWGALAMAATAAVGMVFGVAA